MKTLFLLFLLFLPSFTVTGAHGLSCRPVWIEAEEGDNVTLQCGLDPPDNLVDKTVDWKRSDTEFPSFVHVYRNKHDDRDPQLERYRDRTSLSHEDLSRGIVTLQIFSVNVSDSGTYECSVPKLGASGTIHLHVGEGNNRKTDTAGTTRAPLAGVIIICTVAILLLCVFIVALVWMCGGINRLKNCIKRLGGRKKQEEEAASNRFAMQVLNTQASEGVEDELGKFM